MTAPATQKLQSVPKRLPYAAARDDIQTGDLIALRSRKGLYAWAIRIVTASPYTHTGIALWCGGRLLVAETRSGPASLVPLSQYEPHDFDVFAPPVDEKNVAWYAREMAFKTLGTQIDYAWGDIIRIALHQLLRVPLPKHRPDRLICSSLSELIYTRMGWRPTGIPTIPTPRDLVAAINKLPRMEVRRG